MRRILPLPSSLRPLLGLALGSLLAAAPQAPAPKPQEPGKNLKVFNGQGLTDRSLDEAMDFMSASLGVSCAHCHVKDEAKKAWAMDRDDKPEKQVARRMVQMTRALNQAHFKGEEIITCATCHQGHRKPEAMPPLRAVGAPRPVPPPVALPVLPTAESLIAKWVQAAGGQAALAGLTTRITQATLETGRGPAMSLEVVQKGGAQRSTLATPRGPLVEGVDARHGWTARGGKTEAMEAAEAAQLRAEADLQLPLRLREHYPGLLVMGRDTVNGRELITVAATPKEGDRVLLGFDGTTGLLVQRTAFTETPLGRMATETTWEDFRAVDGVQVPFKVVTRSPQSASVLTCTSVRQNVPVDDAQLK